MLPRVILYNGVSLDGRMDWYAGDVGLYYEVAAHWEVDAMLSGSETMVAAFAAEEPPMQDEEVPEAPERAPDDPRPLLVVVDSRGRFRHWRRMLKVPYWRDGVALCSQATPQSYLDYLQQSQVDYILAGGDHVDLRAALEELNARYGVRVVRVDSGGVLNGALLRAGLVDEVSVLVHPSLVGGTSPRSIFVAPDLTSPDGVISLKLTHVEQIRDDNLWLRYDVVGNSEVFLRQAAAREQ
jgi:2,5-diamino-6-(ribosylamino)-4(3H)-pyrimidinone 5'-phosphate reductase